MFVELPVLHDLYDHKTARSVGELGRVGVVGCQHLLESTGSLIEFLCSKGLSPHHVFLLGKIYSTNDSVAERLRRLGCRILDGSSATAPGEHGTAIQYDARTLWSLALEHFRETKISRLIIIDDGGTIHLTMPSVVQQNYDVVGIEQTTFGMARNVLIGAKGIPVINVASSAAKRYFETPLICNAILERARTVISEFQSKPACGVIGLGKIGLFLADSLRSEDLSVAGFDTNPQRLEMLLPAEQCASPSEVIKRSNLVFGCVGEDSLRLSDLDEANGKPRVLASCSSSDVEFRSVLREAIPWIPTGHPMDVCPTLTSQAVSRRRNLRILRSGYPVNFDNSPESVPSEDIQLTRSLLLSGVLQACGILARGVPSLRSSLMLDPEMQRVAVLSWGHHTGREIAKSFDLGWFIQESQGSRWSDD